ncbi:hypothetical protein BT93_G1687 [Corymbia citriodora subsp. variegata]|nr:hypothetical protein BT93_G1687 [Corymbia citriodora subsp. variegata]
MKITKILAEAQNLWMALNLRVAILVSLALQAFLIFFAPIRKRQSKWWITIPLWSAYLVSDSVALYAFGLISKAQINGAISDSQVDASGHLLAFWAPFLLLHLGGPYTITAFALEDNELWGRHLLNLLIHLASACYVFYQSLPGNKLIVPSILMFIGGSIKYIARARALYLASFRTLRGSLLPSPDPGPNYARFMEGRIAQKEAIIQPLTALTAWSPSRHVGGKILDDRTVIKVAFFYFKKFKGLLVDLIFSFHDRNNSVQFFSSRPAKDAFRVIEAELNFFYDLLYTKSGIVHSPAGYIYRAIQISCIVAAFASFHVLNKHGFHEYDVQITYTLLLGAIGLEFAILGMVICSDWTIAKIGTSEEHGRSLFLGSIFIKFLLKFKSESSPFALRILSARWSKSLSQYNLIDSRLRRWPKWIEKLIDARLRKWPKWIEEPLSLIPLREWFDDLKSGRVEPYNDKLGELIFDELKQKASIAGNLQSIKDMCAARGIWALKNTKTKEDLAGIGQIRFQDTCAETDRFFHEKLSDENKTIKYACKSLLLVPTRVKPANVKGDKSKSALFDACILAKELGKLGETKWVILSEVWMELLAYAASHCRPNMHAQQLSKGGELVTIVWLLMVHLGLSEQFQIEGGTIHTSVDRWTVAGSAKDEAPTCKFHCNLNLFTPLFRFFM